MNRNPCRAAAHLTLALAASLLGPLLGCKPSSPGSEDRSGARITITPETIDLGTVEQYEEIPYKVVIGNDGDRSLDITRVKTSCGCTTSDLRRWVIDPGDEEEMWVTFSSGGMSGRVKRNVRIDSSDPTQPRRVLWLTALVIETPLARIEVEPTAWDVGVTSPGETIRREFRLRNDGDKVLTVNEITAFPGCAVEWDGPIDIDPGEETTFGATLSVPGGNIGGVLGGEIGIESSDPIRRRIAVPVFAYAKGGVPSLWTEYPLWHFGALEAGEEIEGSIQIENRGGAELEIRFAGISGVREGVAVGLSKAQKIPPGGNLSVPIRVTSDAPPGVLNSLLTFESTDPFRGEFDVAVIGFIRESGSGDPAAPVETLLSKVNRREFLWFVGSRAPEESVLDRTLIIRNDMERVFHLEMSGAQGARLDVTGEHIGPGEEVVIEAHLFPIEKLGIGRWDLLLRGRLGDADEPKTMTIPCNALLPRGAPEADLSSRAWDFGDVESGAGLSHTIRISNHGNRGLRVEAIRDLDSTTAGLTFDPPSSFVVQAGDFRDVIVTLRDPFYRGTVLESALIRSNDPAFGEISFVVQGHVRGISVEAPPREGHHLEILYSSDELGRLGPCTCEEGQIGGFARAARFTERQGPRALVLHAGDLFGDPEPHQKLRAEASIEIAHETGYEVMALGEAEFAFGREFLETSLSRARFEIISANVFDVESGELLTRLPWVKIERGALRIGVIATLGPELISERKARELGIRLEDPSITLGREVPKMRATCDLVILLAHTAEDRLELLLEMRPDVDLVIQGHGAGVTTHPQIVGGIPWVQNCDRGKYMARLDLILSTTGVIVWAEGKKTPLAEEIGESEDVIRLIEAYQEKLKTLPVPDLIAQGGPDHVGAAQCKSCHSKEHAIWQGSSHRDGLDSLASKNSDYDPECLACHTTGYRLPGGFLRREETPDRGGVQCEACHGPGSEHVVEAENGEVAPYGKVEQDHCFVCHDSENSPHFQFDIYWAKIKHGPN